MIRRILLLTCFLAAAVLAQDEAIEDDTAPDPTDTAAEDAAESEDDFDVLDGSEDHTKEDEDVFIPSDEVSYQQSVPFPTDI